MNPPIETIHTVVAAPRSRMRNVLRTWLRREADIRIVGEAPNGLAAVRLIRKTEPDLVFVHTELPRLDGFGVLEALAEGARWRPPAVIMISSSGVAAVRAFHIRATDYLQIPFEVTRLQRALGRVRQLLWHHARVNGGTTAGNAAGTAHRLGLRSRGRVVLVEPAEVRWARAARARTVVHCEGAVRTVDLGFGEWVRRLPRRGFAVINRSTVVRTDFIREITPKSHGDRWVVLEDGTRLILSRSRRVEVLRWL